MALKRARQRIAFAYPRLSHRWSFTGNLNDGVGDRELKKQFDKSISVGSSKCTLERALLYSDNIDFNGPFTIELWVNHVANDSQSFAIYDDFSRNRSKGLAFSWQVRGPCFGRVSNGNCDPIGPIPYYQDVYIAATYDPAKGNMCVTRYKATHGANDLASCTNVLSSPVGPHPGLALGCEWNFPCWGWYGRWALANADYSEVRVWNRCLAPEEIRASMQTGPDALAIAFAEDWSKPVVDKPFSGKNASGCSSISSLRRIRRR